LNNYTYHFIKVLVTQILRAYFFVASEEQISYFITSGNQSEEKNDNFHYSWISTQFELSNVRKSMEAYRIEKKVAANGVLHLDALPFREGELVEVIVLPYRERAHKSASLFLRGKVIEYIAPTEPVAQDEWDALL